MEKEINYCNLDDKKNEKLWNIFKNFMLVSYLWLAWFWGYMYHLDKQDIKNIDSVEEKAEKNIKNISLDLKKEILIILSEWSCVKSNSFINNNWWKIKKYFDEKNEDEKKDIISFLDNEIENVDDKMKKCWLDKMWKILVWE